MRSKFIKGLSCLAISTMLTFGSCYIAKALPATSISQSDLSQLKSMTQAQLNSAAKPMPDSALITNPNSINKAVKVLSLIPEDGNIYTFTNNVSGHQDVMYYKFLYISPDTTEPGTVGYSAYKWEFVDGNVYASTVATGYETDYNLYNQLTSNSSSNSNSGGGASSPRQGQSGTSSTGTQTSGSDNSNSGNNSNNGSNSSAKKYIKKRLAGTSRITTALQIAQEFNNGSIDNVVIATGYDFPDALAGSVLAKKLNAPILLVGSDNIENQLTIDYINSHLNKSGSVYIIGGQGAVSDSVVDSLKALGYSNFTRLAGYNRFDTSAKISSTLSVPTGTPIVIATGTNYPDALSISSIAAAKGYPILLTGTYSLSNEVTATISSIQPSKVYIVGGAGAVSDNVINSIKSLVSADIVRLYGSNRYETSLNIAKYFNIDTDTVAIATGENFPDALAGSVLAAKNNAPILLVGSDVSEQKQYIDQTKYTNEILLGGTGAVSTEIEDLLSK